MSTQHLVENKSQADVYNEQEVLHELKHFLPAQAPLKDFIHHNTLHAFQNQKFFKGTQQASGIFGYKVSLSLNEYRLAFINGRITEEILERVIIDRFGEKSLFEWKGKAITKRYDMSVHARVGSVREHWEKCYHVDLDTLVHPVLFRTICSYLDQGISIWNFPVLHKGFLNSIREIEKNTYSSFFKSRRAKKLLNSRCKISELLKIVVGDESLYKHYLFDQQFAHQGWSGMVSTVEDYPETLLDTKRISLKDVIIFELLLEIDALDTKFGEIWAPLATKVNGHERNVFKEIPETELQTVLSIWQEAYEWSYYDNVLRGIQQKNTNSNSFVSKTFQSIFCIDDREISLRDYLEKEDSSCETFATPGFFGIEFYFQPEHGKSYTKQCPAPVTPKYLIKEIGAKEGRKKDIHLAKRTHSLVQGFIIGPTLGFWSAIRLLFSIFRPTITPATASSFSHMDQYSKLSIEFDETVADENGLQIGFKVEEMTSRVEAMLKSIGLIKEFAPLLYLVGHGSSSTNNPHYAAYNCGACCGRPGSVNARVFAYMANLPSVRKNLASKGILIPETTQFIGGLHDTTRDEIIYYDEEVLTPSNSALHELNKKVFNKALDLNAKERSRRFELTDTKRSLKEIHKKILIRSVSLFEPRPELNHATNSLCIVGSRELTKNLFLDRRAFANSYDYTIDPEGSILTNIMRPIGPVCGGINLEYFFSRVDNHKLGAGTKLPHNVMGLFGVANGFDGDLRPGLPSQMIEVHEPVRILVIVEQFPEIVLKTIQSDKSIYEWYANEWMHLVCINPLTKELYSFKNDQFHPYTTLSGITPTNANMMHLIENSSENLPVFITN